MINEDLYIQAKAFLAWKFKNVLKGEANSIKDNKTLSDDERQAKMKAIEDFLHYIQSFDRNTKLLAEYEELKLRMIDDGR